MTIIQQLQPLLYKDSVSKMYQTIGLKAEALNPSIKWQSFITRFN